MNPPRRSTVNFLRVVESAPKPEPVSVSDIQRPAWQSTLFAAENPSLLIFVHFEQATEMDFLSFLMAARPRCIVDLRLVPRFDIGGLNRGLVFSLFTQMSTQYFDLTGQLKIRESRDAQFNPVLLVKFLQSTLFKSDRAIQGPIGFLVDGPQFDEDYVRALSEILPSPAESGWDVLRIPQSTSSSSKAAGVSRNLIFISHANPEDNEFAEWLGAQLSNAGYTVWADFTNLIGGEEFWDSIEDAIRFHAARVVVVLSRRAQTKKGVLDEVNLAVSVERSLGLSDFVVPIRIDGMSFSDVRANLARKNIIDFSENWATGLSRLLVAFEKAGIPRPNTVGPSSTADWYRHNLASNEQVVQEPETLISNWLQLLSIPEQVSMLDVMTKADRIAEVMAGLETPCFPYLRLIGTFSDAFEGKRDADPTSMVMSKYRIPTARFLAGRPADLPGLQSKEAHKFVVSMLRQAWDRKAAAMGLQPYVAASGATIWYVPKGLLDGNQVSFVDNFGKTRRKLLVGWSEKRQVHWHFGIQARPVIGRTPRVVLKTHVVFSTDGKTPLASKERMHVLRRSFCKNWWNDRWRDLLMGFVAWLSSKKSEIELHCGGNAVVALSGSLLAFRSPVSILPEADGGPAELAGPTYDDEDEPDLEAEDVDDILVRDDDQSYVGDEVSVE